LDAVQATSCDEVAELTSSGMTHSCLTSSKTRHLCRPIMDHYSSHRLLAGRPDPSSSSPSSSKAAAKAKAKAKADKGVPSLEQLNYYLEPNWGSISIDWTGHGAGSSRLQHITKRDLASWVFGPGGDLATAVRPLLTAAVRSTTMTTTSDGDGAAAAAAAGTGTAAAAATNSSSVYTSVELGRSVMALSRRACPLDLQQPALPYGATGIGIAAEERTSLSSEL
jgi:hypothetical protein